MQAIIDYGGLRPAIGRMEFELTDEAVGVSNIVAGRAVRIDAGPAVAHDFPASDIVYRRLRCSTAIPLMLISLSSRGVCQ